MKHMMRIEENIKCVFIHTHISCEHDFSSVDVLVQTMEKWHTWCTALTTCLGMKVYKQYIHTLWWDVVLL